MNNCFLKYANVFRLLQRTINRQKENLKRNIFLYYFLGIKWAKLCLTWSKEEKKLWISSLQSQVKVRKKISAKRQKSERVKMNLIRAMYHLENSVYSHYNKWIDCLGLNL